MSKVATYAGRLGSQGKLPGHAKNNLKHNVSVISLRSGKRFGDPVASEPEKEADEGFEEVLDEEDVKEINLLDAILCIF